jgi:hypothetical protein
MLIEKRWLPKFIGVIVFAFISMIGITVSASLSPSGLIAWWRAEGNAVDSIGGYNGTLQGVTFATGKVGQAFSFNGSTDKVDGYIDLRNVVTNNFTMAFWVYPNATRNSTIETNSEVTGIAGWGQKYAIAPQHGGDVDYAGAGVSVGTNGVSIYEHATDYMPSTLVYDTPISGWTHIAVVYINRQPNLYINGTWVRTGMISARNYVFPSTQFGEGYNYQYGSYSGLLDEVKIFNRALSASEVATLTNTNNFPPTVPVLTNPENGHSFLGNKASLYWQKSTDPEGGNVTYRVQVAEDPGFTSNLQTFNVDGDGSLMEGRIVVSAAAMLPFLALLGWRGRNKRKQTLMLLIAAILLTTPLFISCSSKDGGVTSSYSNGDNEKDTSDGLGTGAMGLGGLSTGTIDENTISFDVTGLQIGTTYYWRVIAVDEQNNTSGPSETRSFTTGLIPLPI